MNNPSSQHQPSANEAEAHVVANDQDNNSTSELSKSAWKQKKRQELKEERKANLKKRRQEKQANKSVGTSNENLDQSEYYFENGLRKVYP